MAKVQIMYWHHIPTQVKATDESGAVVRKPLPDRFTAAVDQAAMDNGLAGTDAYLAGWRWGDAQTVNGDAEQAVLAAVAQIIAKFEGKAIPLEIEGE